MSLCIEYTTSKGVSPEWIRPQSSTHENPASTNIYFDSDDIHLKPNFHNTSNTAELRAVQIKGRLAIPCKTPCGKFH